MPSIKHVHTYERLKNKPQYYRCIHPDCSHFQNKVMLKGKRATCICGAEFFLTSADLRMKNPHCQTCSKSQVKKAEIETLEKILATLPPRKEKSIFDELERALNDEDQNS